MATSFSKKIRNGLMLGILGLGLVAIVVTGFGTDGMGGLGSATGPNAETVVEVGDERITDAEVSQRMGNAYRQAVQQQPTLEREQFIQANFGAMLDQMIDGKALTAFAHNLGFVVPQSMVDRVIVSIPAFQNVAGQFDDATFRRALQSAGLTERELRDDIAASQLIRMVTAPVGQTARVPDALARAYADLLLETRVGGLGAVPSQLIAQNIQPSEQEVAAFYRQNQRQFVLPERRVLRYALLGPEQLGDSVRATDQEIAAYYQQNQAEYGPQETRSLQLFTTQDEAAARRLVEQVRGGTPFVQAAQAAGFTAEDVNLPNLSREQFAGRTNQEVANAAFGAQQGAVLGPIRSQLGFQVVRVEGVNRTPGRPLASVRAEIVQAIEQRKLSEQLAAAVERIDNRLAEGESFAEIVRAERLNVQTTPPVTQAGAGQGFQLPQNLAPLLQTAFELSPDDDPLVEVTEPDRQAALVQVANVVPPAAPPLEQIRDQVRQRLIQQTASQRARAIADSVAEKINNGMAPAQAYAQAGVRLPSPEEVTLRRYQIAQQGQQVPPPLTVLFSIPEGRARVIAAPNNAGWIIVHHRQRRAGNSANDPLAAQALQSTQTGISQNAQEEIAAQFARAVRAQLDVSPDEGRVGALRQRLLSGQ